MSATARPDLSIIIVSWNTRDLLRGCLRSLAETLAPVTAEIIVVDNASSDGTAAMVAADFPAVRLIANADNRGFAAANNQGLAIATGREPVVMGGVLRKELRPAQYSAGGPVTKPATEPLTRYGPDALAVSDDSVVHWGVLAAGSRSGSVFPINGTSIATPRIARWLAGEHAIGNPGGRGKVADLAAKYENGPPKLPDRPSVERGGAGRILLGPVYTISRFDS